MLTILPQIPKILIVENNGWKYFFYEEFRELFKNFDEDPLNLYRGIQSKPFRIQISIQTVTFLVGIFPELKEFRFYTTRLNQELFLLNQLETLKDEEFLAFREHTKKIATLSPKEFPTQSEINTQVFQLENLGFEQKYRQIEKETNFLVDRLLQKMNNYRPSLLERLSDSALTLASNYSLIRIHLLKFLAILPSLEYDSSGKEIKRAYLEALKRLRQDNRLAISEKRKGEDQPLPTSLTLFFRLLSFISIMVPSQILSELLKLAVKLMAKRFIAGENIESAEGSLDDIFNSGRDVTLDQLGELVVSEKEADHYQNEVIKLIQGFSLYIKKGEKNNAGINRAHVSIKISALCSDFKPYAKSYTYSLVAPRLKKILLEAKSNDVFVNIDAEHIHYRDVVFYIYKRVLLETEELHHFSSTGIVLQGYLRDSFNHLSEIIGLARERGIIMPVRLVKGAYWDAETIEADAHGHEAFQFLNKEETDINFRQLAEEILKSSSQLQLCLASHNYSDHCYVEVLRNKIYPHSPVIEHQCLHMTYEALSTALVEMGFPVRNYLPVGSLLVGMAYLVRRIMENSSQVGILTIMRSHKDLKKIQAPEKVLKKNKKTDILKLDLSRVSLTSEFINVPPVRIYLPKESQIAERALSDFAKDGIKKDYPNVLPLSGENIKIFSNSDNIQIGEIKYATIEDTALVIQQLNSAYLTGIWSDLSWIVRSSCLLKAARIMTARRLSLASLMVYEGGKIFTEALADVDEAIDFLNFYAREEGRVQKDNPGLKARGVIGVISPWNFPLAIPCGMVASALVAGNSVILKSARPTPLIAQRLTDILHEAGIPKNVLAHLPGKGSDVGEVIVNSPDVAGLVFTGSKSVGLHLAHHASKKMIKNSLHGDIVPAKVITEMGGKNAIIVTSSAELDEAVAGILYSAFGHSGQKCSAASRILVDQKIKDKLVERLKAACLDIKVGKAFDLSSTMNPIISLAERERLKRDVEEAILEAKKYSGKVHVNRSKEELPGACMGPVLIELPSPRAFVPESYSQKELFGPVLHIIGYRDIDEAIKIFNCTEYALTGGIFSQSQSDIDVISRQLESGNIYVNRGITGARVAIEPFGGFKLSGTGPKAGGTAYVPSFHICPLNLPVETTNIKDVPPNEEGESYIFDLCFSGNYEEKELIGLFDQGMEKLIQNFENLFDGIYGNQKEVLNKLREFALQELKGLRSRKKPNREIPGQLSYNDFNLADTKIVVVAFEPRAYFSTLVEVLIALSMGIGVSILARNHQAYNWWNKVNSFFHKFKKDRTFDVFFPNQNLLETSLSAEDLRTIIIDGGKNQVLEILNLVYSDSYQEKLMRQVITPFDSPNVLDFPSIVEKLVLVRSFAVNIMRHGAPMNLN